MAAESTTTVEHLSIRPAGMLAPHVDRCVGYRMSGFEPGVHAGLPSTSLTFIVSFDDPIDLRTMPDPHQAPDRLWSMVGGLHSSPATIAHDGNQHGLQLDVTPAGARALFGLPTAALANTVVPLEALIGTQAHELHDRLDAATGWSDRFTILQSMLQRRLEGDPAERHRTTRPELMWAWYQICHGRGTLQVAALAEELGWSRRHLSAQFRVEYGVSPTTMNRIVRFQQARELLQRPDRPTLAAAAALSGYADQAHLTREWTRLAGSPPAAWLRDEEFPSVQDEGQVPAAG